MSIPFFSEPLVAGFFNTFLQMWLSIRVTFVSIFDFFTRTALNKDFSVISALIGPGLLFILGYWIIKFFNPLS